MSLQLMLIEFPGSNVRSIKLLFFSSIFTVLSWKSEDKTAFQIKSTSEVQSFVVTVAKIEHNVSIDPSLFAKPAN